MESSFCQHLRDELDTIEKVGLKIRNRHTENLCVSKQTQPKNEKLLIMKERTLNALELWKILVNPFALELNFQSLIP